MFSIEVTVAWGDCDPAGIVWYPGYFRWFDTCFQRLLHSRGTSQAGLGRRFGILGTGLAEAGASFLRPVSEGEILQIGLERIEWQPRRFRCLYRVSREGTPVAEGFERRAWMRREADGTIRGAEIPAEFQALLSGDAP